jgi:hypothetical protein
MAYSYHILGIFKIYFQNESLALYLHLNFKKYFYFFNPLHLIFFCMLFEKKEVISLRYDQLQGISI